MPNTSDLWKEFLKVKKLRIEFFITLFLLILSLALLANFLNYVEAREGIILNDPILNLFKPINLTWLTFSLIYVSLFIAITFLIQVPPKLIIAVQAYIILVLIRIAAMYVVPLNPPAGMISLNDPLVEYFGTGQLLTKDLFFSGHTATIFLFYLVSEKKLLKLVFLVFTIIVGISVLLQHVHYTIDVVAAPFFAFAAYRLTLFLNRIFNLYAKSILN